MPDVSCISDFPIKAIFLVHFVLTSFGTLGFWAPNAYIFYNFILLILLLWSLHSKQSADPVQLAFCVNIAAIFMDVFLLAFNYPDSHQSGSTRFSALLSILHLIVRPFTTLYLMQAVRERMGNPNLLSNIFPTTHNQNYEDIDHSGPKANMSPGDVSERGDYDFSAAQQI